MNKEILKDGLGWGFVLWFVGYVLGFIFFAFIPVAIMGWFIMPIGIVVAYWVLIKKIKNNNLNHYFKIAFIWLIMAILLDYIFLVKLLKPADGYYKLDIYLYYVITFLLPLLVGWRRSVK